MRFEWGPPYQQCFDRIKGLVTNCMTLSHYDRSKPVTLQTDYSEKGIGVVLVQQGRPVQFASKALVGGEVDLAPIEGEMLAVLYGIQKFHTYLYGRKFIVESDHRPLQHIHKKNLGKAPPRLRDMLQAVSDYDFRLQWRPGREMGLPDALSRLSQSDKKEVPGRKVSIHELVNISVPRLKLLREETEADAILVQVRGYVRNGWPSSIKELEKDVKPYWSIRDDVSFIDGLVMAGSRIIIPQVSRRVVLQSIHEGHQGETKCNLRAKSAVYWPGIYKDIENMVKSCSSCREFENAQPKCPMLSTEVPTQPWHTIGSDLFKYKGKWHLLVTDLYSKAPFVRSVANTGAQATVKAMKSIFSENGVPVNVISDNGPHFSAGEYKRFSERWGFDIILSSPEYPQGHALIERHIQTVKKCMYKCDASGYDFDLAMLALRSTPLTADLPSPAELLQQRQFRSTLPVIVSDPKDSSAVREKLLTRQVKAAARYDKGARAKEDLSPGENVRLYNKSSRRWEPAKVVGDASTPRSYFVQRMEGGRMLRRNRVHMKPTRENWDSRQFVDDSVEDLYVSDPYIRAPTPDSVMDNVPVPDGEVATVPASPASPVTTVPMRRTNRVRKQRDFYQAGSSK